MNEFKVRVIGKTINSNVPLNLLMNKINVAITNYLLSVLQDVDYTISSDLGTSECYITIEVKQINETRKNL